MTVLVEPPPEHRDKLWHWLRNPRRTAKPALWIDADGGFWILIGTAANSRAFRASEMFERGWRYIGPALPPEVA